MADVRAAFCAAGDPIGARSTKVLIGRGDSPLRAQHTRPAVRRRRSPPATILTVVRLRTSPSVNILRELASLALHGRGKAGECDAFL